MSDFRRWALGAGSWALGEGRWGLGAGLAGVGLLVAALGGPAAPSLSAQTPAGPAAGNGTFYISSYKGAILVVDEATGRVTGEIPSQAGIPGFDMTLSGDRSKIYVLDSTGEKVEIFDRAKQASVDMFTLSQGSTKTRISDMAPDPKDRFVVLTIKNYTLKTDRWEVGPSTLVQFDLASKKIARTIPWPKGEEREGAGVLFSPDGSLMYLIGEDVLIYETTNFTEVDRWDVSRPIEMGAGRVSFGGFDPFTDEPGFFTGLLTMQDPLQNRRIMGIGRIDLLGKKRGYGVMQDIGEYELWTFDLENYRLLSRTPFQGRPRMTVKVSTSGNLLYIYQAGNTIDVYEAATFRHLRTLTFDADMTNLLLVPPGM